VFNPGGLLWPSIPARESRMACGHETPRTHLFFNSLRTVLVTGGRFFPFALLPPCVEVRPMKRTRSSRWLPCPPLPGVLIGDLLPPRCFEADPPWLLAWPLAWPLACARPQVPRPLAWFGQSREMWPAPWQLKHLRGSNRGAPRRAKAWAWLLLRSSESRRARLAGRAQNRELEPEPEAADTRDLHAAERGGW